MKSLTVTSRMLSRLALPTASQYEAAFLITDDWKYYLDRADWIGLQECLDRAKCLPSLDSLMQNIWWHFAEFKARVK